MQQGHGPNPAANDAGPEKKVPPPRIVYDLGPSSSSHGSHTGASPEYLGGMRLDAADAHLDLEIDPSTGLSASCLHTNGFQYTWKGVRTTYGVKGFGQYYFETKVVKCPTVVMPETPANTQNVCRIGVSLPLSSLFLGESSESWGFGGTAKKSFSRRFENYGQPYGLGDVIGTIIDLDHLKLSYTKNGVFLGTAYDLPPRVRDSGIFPHLYLKNVDVQVNFKSDSQWFAPPNPKIQFVGDVLEKDLLPNPVEHPRNVKECEFIMMVGLPACGKTFWAEQHCRQNPAKSYVLLGTNAIIDQMRVVGVKRQANYAERWEELMSTATAAFNALVDIAGSGRVPRNIIIDQTNVFRNARRRKVQPFREWGVRRAVTIVTDEATLQQRTAKREQEEGKFVPVSAVMDMKAAFVLPSLEDGFTVIAYTEMPEYDSRQEVRRMNEEGRRFKRENPQATGNQPKPHIETRKAEEIGSGFDDCRGGKRQRTEWADNYGGGPWHSQNGFGGDGHYGGSRHNWSQDNSHYNGQRGGAYGGAQHPYNGDQGSGRQVYTQHGVGGPDGYSDQGRKRGRDCEGGGGQPFGGECAHSYGGRGDYGGSGRGGQGFARGGGDWRDNGYAGGDGSGGGYEGRSSYSFGYRQDSYYHGHAGEGSHGSRQGYSERHLYDDKKRGSQVACGYSDDSREDYFSQYGAYDSQPQQHPPYREAGGGGGRGGQGDQAWGRGGRGGCDGRGDGGYAQHGWRDTTRGYSQQEGYSGGDSGRGGYSQHGGGFRGAGRDSGYGNYEGYRDSGTYR